MAELITIARPYAEAVFAYAKEKDQLAKWSEELMNLAIIASNEEMQGVLANPAYSSEKIIDIFSAVMGKNLTNEGKNLLTVMAENKRLLSVPKVSTVFEELKRIEEGRFRATVISAVEVTAEQKKILSVALNAKFNAQVEISYEKDSSLIAGIKIKVGDWVVDGSALSQINKLGAAIAQ